MSLRSPEPLSVGHQLENFDCDKSSLNEWLLRHARQAQASGFAKTFVVADDDRVAGFFSLTFGQVDTVDASERIRKGMGQYPAAWPMWCRLKVLAQRKEQVVFAQLATHHFVLHADASAAVEGGSGVAVDARFDVTQAGVAVAKAQFPV